MYEHDTHLNQPMFQHLHNCETFLEMITILDKTFGIRVKKIADLVTFTEKILNGKLYFLCSGRG